MAKASKTPVVEEVAVAKELMDTGSYKLTEDDLRIIVGLIANTDWRTFEKYLAYKQNKLAHKLILADEEKDVMYYRAQIKAVGSITRDLKAMWTKVNREIDNEQTPDMFEDFLNMTQLV